MSANDFKGKAMVPWCSAGCFFSCHHTYSILSFEGAKLLLMHLAKAYSPTGEFTPPRGWICTKDHILNYTAAILAMKQCLLNYNTCRRFLILRSVNSSRLLHLPELIVLADSKSRGMLVLAGDFLSCKQLVGVLYLPGKENDLRPSTG